MSNENRETFDPRQAALYHAGETVTIAHNRLTMTLAEATNAIVCGLVYVGDAIRSVDRPNID